MTANTPNVTPQNTENEEEVPQKAPLGLIIVVVVLGIALVGMLGLIIMKIVSGDHKKKPEAEVIQQAMPRVPPGNNYGIVPTGENYSPQGIITGNSVSTLPANSQLGDLQLKRPENSTLISYSANGNEVFLHFQLENGDDVIITLNRMTGDESRITIAK